MPTPSRPDIIRRNKHRLELSLHRLNAAITTERQRLLPDDLALQRLKKSRVTVMDQLRSLERKLNMVRAYSSAAPNAVF
ncbi:MAG: hypothetical protein AAGA69_06495 [Pseudomonadota bacterium]